MTERPIDLPLGLHKGVRFEDYGRQKGVNASLLKTVHNHSLAHAKAQLEGKFKQSSDALDFGTSFHELLLRGRKDYIIRPSTYAAPPKHEKVKAGVVKEGDPLPWNANAAACKAWLAEMAGASTILSEEDAADIEAMVAAVRSEADLALYLNDTTDCEVAAICDKNGQRMKAMIDLLPNGEDSPVIDFKSAGSAKPERFIKDVANFGYDMQMAFYLDVLRELGQKRQHFWIVAVESSAPHAACVYKFTDEPVSFIWSGRRKYREAMDRYVTAKETQCWPGYGSIHTPEHFAPHWMKEELVG